MEDRFQTDSIIFSCIPKTGGATVKIGEFIEFLPRALKARKRVLAVGPPGCGKTDGFTQVCKALGWDMLTSVLPLDDPSTIRGYPVKPNGESGAARHCLFDTAYRAFHATKPTLWFLDDAGQASESTLKSVMRIVQFGELDGMQLPECVSICAATNDVGHGAGVYGMIEPLKSRFHTIVNVETNVDDVCAFGMARNWAPWLIAFLHNSPESLNDWKPSKSMKLDGACPRGWEYLNGWDAIGVQDSEVWAGCVGKGQAAKALAFRGLINELPDIDGCMIDPEGSPVPKNPSAKLLIAMAMAARMTGGNFGNAVRYLNRLDAMFRAYAIRDAFRAENQRRKDGSLDKNYKQLASSRDFTAWACSEDGKAVMAAAN